MDRFYLPDIESTVVGAALIDPSDLAGLSTSDFTNERLRLIFDAIQSAEDGGACFENVVAELVRRNQLDKVGGQVFLAELMDQAPTMGAIPRYAKVLKEATLRRDLADTGRKIQEIASGARSAREAVDRAAGELATLESRGTSTAVYSVNEALKGYFQKLDERQKNGGGLTGVPTGFSDLDQITNGLQPGDLILIAARPSMGKTALALNLADEATAQGVPTLIFSLEMSRHQLIERLLAGRAKVNSHRLRSGMLKDNHWGEVVGAAGELNKRPLMIDDSPALSPLDIRAKARQTARQKGLGLILIDYLGMIRPIKSQNNREREVSEISRSLKALAKELDVPVVVACQLNRNLEAGGTPRRPVMSDLRESGSLEQDADVVLFPWREAAFCQVCRDKNKDCGKEHFRTADIIVGKHRNGPVGSVPALWLPELSSYKQLSQTDS